LPDIARHSNAAAIPTITVALLIHKKKVKNMPVPRSDDSPDFRSYRQKLLALRTQLQVAHHLPGRLRLKVRPGAPAVKVLRQTDIELETLRQMLPGVSSLKFNALAGSLVLEYNQEIMPFTLMDTFFRTTSPDQAEHLLDCLISIDQQKNGEPT
jgi:hypothetical protein